MPRKRKVSVVEANQESRPNKKASRKNVMFEIIENAQVNESMHNKYVKEMQQHYEKIDHSTFMKTIIDILKQLFQKDETHTFVNLGVKYMSKFISSYFDSEDMHPVLLETFQWLLKTVATVPVVQFRMCEFVNLLLNSLGTEAVLDDSICDNILKYMFDRLKSHKSPNVRLQAIHALQRLQVKDNQNDKILKIYKFHLSSDPSPMVRQAVITSISRNFHTIPFILERLWDIDERVRRHTYLQMSSYPVRSYKVAQRLTFLEQGLNDHSDMVKKVVNGILLPQWLSSYNKDYIEFLSGLKLDANVTEMDRFRKTARLALLESFKRQSVDELIEVLPLKNDDETHFKNCIPLDKLSVETCLYWLSLIEYLQKDEEKLDDVDRILPELSLFCEYVSEYCKKMEYINIAKWQKLNHQYILLSLFEILQTYDLADEFGRKNLITLINTVLIDEDLNEAVIKLVKCLESLIVEHDARLNFVVDAINNIVNVNVGNTIDITDRTLMDAINVQLDPNLQVKVSSIKLQILELKEHETDFIERKDYVKASEAADALTSKNEELINLLRPILTNLTTSTDPTVQSAVAKLSSVLNPRKLTPDTIIKCLQIIFCTVASKNVRSLTPGMCKLYKDFIRRQIESNQLHIRNWAFKCGISFSMLYDVLAKDVYIELYAQFYKNECAIIWSTAIKGLFELIDRYGFDYFESDPTGNDQDHQDPAKNKSRKSARQLCNVMDNCDPDEESTTPRISGTTVDNSPGDNSPVVIHLVDILPVIPGKSDFILKLPNQLNMEYYLVNNTRNCQVVCIRNVGVDLMLLFGHLYETCSDVNIISALIEGYCRLILHGHYSTNDLISKLMIEFFKPATEPEINQILGIFFESLIKKRKQECLQPALLPTIHKIMEAPNDSPLLEIKPEAILKFVIDSTFPIYCSPGLNIHNTLAMSFLQEMLDNIDNKDILRLLSKELLILVVSDDRTLRNDWKNCLDKLFESTLELKTKKNLKQFKQILERTYKGPLMFSSAGSGVIGNDIEEAPVNVPDVNESDITDQETGTNENDPPVNVNRSKENNEIRETGLPETVESVAGVITTDIPDIIVTSPIKDKEPSGSTSKGKAQKRKQIDQTATTSSPTKVRPTRELRNRTDPKSVVARPLIHTTEKNKKGKNLTEDLGIILFPWEVRSAQSLPTFRRDVVAVQNRSTDDQIDRNEENIESIDLSDSTSDARATNEPRQVENVSEQEVVKTPGRKRQASKLTLSNSKTVEPSLDVIPLSPNINPQRLITKTAKKNNENTKTPRRSVRNKMPTPTTERQTRRPSIEQFIINNIVTRSWSLNNFLRPEVAIEQLTLRSRNTYNVRKSKPSVSVSPSKTATVPKKDDKKSKKVTKPTTVTVTKKRRISSDSNQTGNPKRVEITKDKDTVGSLSPQKIVERKNSGVTTRKRSLRKMASVVATTIKSVGHKKISGVPSRLLRPRNVQKS